eukprot:UN31563
MANNGIQLKLRILSTNSTQKTSRFKLQAQAGTTIRLLRQTLAKTTSHPIEKICLYFGTDPLNVDQKTLFDYGIKGGEAKIDVILQENRSHSQNAKVGTKRLADDDDQSMMSASKRVKGMGESPIPDDAMTLISVAKLVKNDQMAMSCVGDNDEDISGWKVSSVPGIYENKAQTTMNSKWKTEVKYCAETLCGGKTKNEDSVLQFQSKDGSITAVGVFDGHGLSAFACTASKLSVKIATAWFGNYNDKADSENMSLWSPSTWKSKFERLFKKMHDILRTQFEKMELNKRKNDIVSGGLAANEKVVDKNGVVRHKNGLPIHGGTTGTIVVLIRTPKGQKLVTAYVGDSEAVLIRKIEKANETGPKYIVLTEGHRALNPKEYRRVHNLPNDKYPIKLLFVYDVDGVRDANLLPKVYLPNGNINTNITENPMSYGLYPSNIRQEPATYAVSPRQPGVDRVRLANTRALGDFYAHPYGLCAVPESVFKIYLLT